MLGSYYQGDYYGNPVPYTQSDIGAPVPGWGVNPFVAGPPRLGVGASVSNIGIAKVSRPFVVAENKTQSSGTTQSGKTSSTSGKTSSTYDEESMILPWWSYPVAAAFALGVVGYYGTKRGWF